MNARNFILSAIGIIAAVAILPKLFGAEHPQRQTYEYLTIPSGVRGRAAA